MTTTARKPAAKHASGSAGVNFVSGTIAGMLGKLLEHPFDTVKVRLQHQQIAGETAIVFRGPLDCARQTWAGEGLRGFYKGLSVPLLNTTIETAFMFTINQTVKRALQSPQDAAEGLPLPKIMASGAVTGFLIAFILTPMDLIKSRLQIQTGAHKRYHGPLDCITKSVATEGVGALFRGLSGTLAREVPGTAVYFTTYELTVKALEPRRESGTEGYVRPPPSPFAAMTGGALSGTMFWATMFPADTVKSVMQTQGPEGQRGFVSTLRTILAQRGIRGLYAGATPTILRAAPSNAVVFLVYEWLSSQLKTVM